MRLLLIGIFSAWLVAGHSQSTSIQWMTWDEMVAQREKDSIPKKVFIDVYTDWCGWCKKMDASTFQDPAVVQAMNAGFYAVKLDAEMMDTIMFNDRMFTSSEPGYVKPHPKARGKTHWFAYSILDGSMSYPSYAILDEQYNRVVVYKGYKQVPEMLGILLFFGSDQYKFYHNFLNQQWNQALQKQQEQGEP